MHFVIKLSGHDGFAHRTDGEEEEGENQKAANRGHLKVNLKRKQKFRGAEMTLMVR